MAATKTLALRAETEFVPISTDDLIHHQSLDTKTPRKTLWKICKWLIRVIMELIGFFILFVSSIVLSILLALLFGDYPRNVLIIWFIFTSFICSSVIYLLSLFCRIKQCLDQTPINIQKFSIIRWSILISECVMIFFVYQWMGSTFAPSLSIFPDLYSTSIPLDVLPYNQSFVTAKEFFQCNLNFQEITMRDVSKSFLIKLIMPDIDFDVAAYVNRATIYTVDPYYIVPDSVIMHELRSMSLIFTE